MDHIELDLRELERVAKDLMVFAEKAIPYAVRDALNEAAFDARKTWQANMAGKFTLRNKWVQNSVRVVKVAELRDIDRMESAVGSMFGPMKLQEYGGKAGSVKGEHKAIPTRAASGEAKGSTPRKKTVRRINRLDNLAVGSSPRLATREQRMAVAIAMASRKGAGKGAVAYIERKAGLAIAMVGRRLGKRVVSAKGNRLHAVKMLYDLSRRSVDVPKHETLQPTLRQVAQALPSAMVVSMRRQLKRRGILGYRG